MVMPVVAPDPYVRLFRRGGGEVPDPDPEMNAAWFYDNKITISDIADIPEGLVFDRIHIEVSGLDWGVIDIIEAPYSDGKAVVALPPDYADDELIKVSREDAFDYTGFWPAKADNLDAKVAGFENIDLFNGEKRVGRVYLTDWEGEGATDYKSFIYYHYSNQPYSLGGYNYTVNNNRVSFRYALSFDKGWSPFAKVNSGDSQLTTCTTRFDDELTTHWRFEPHP